MLEQLKDQHQPMSMFPMDNFSINLSKILLDYTSNPLQLVFQQINFEE